MITENLSTLKIHKLTQAQYDRELEAGRIDANALYLTPDEGEFLSTSGGKMCGSINMDGNEINDVLLLDSETILARRAVETGEVSITDISGSSIFFTISVNVSNRPNKKIINAFLKENGLKHF